MNLRYQAGEKISIRRPVDRISFLCTMVTGKQVLDLGCWDETALIKQNSHFWLHQELANYAGSIIGLDYSSSLPESGYRNNGLRIIKGDCTDSKILSQFDVEIVTAGELIEHLPNPSEFLSTVKKIFPGKDLLLTTPNATTISNVFLGILRRESMHVDHINIFSYKTLATLCKRTKFIQYEIIPYHVRYTEMVLRNKGIKRIMVLIFEKIINALEFVFPLLSGGYIVIIRV
jgi:hypothetical protein